MLAVNLKGAFLLAAGGPAHARARRRAHHKHRLNRRLPWRPRRCFLHRLEVRPRRPLVNIAATYGDQGIRCNIICPGATATNIGESADYTSRGGALIADIAADRLPPSAIASVALFLASEAARDINGAVIPVDRGWALTH